MESEISYIKPETMEKISILDVALDPEKIKGEVEQQCDKDKDLKESEISSLKTETKEEISISDVPFDPVTIKEEVEQQCVKEEGFIDLDISSFKTETKEEISILDGAFDPESIKEEVEQQCVKEEDLKEHVLACSRPEISPVKIEAKEEITLVDEAELVMANPNKANVHLSSEIEKFFLTAAAAAVANSFRTVRYRVPWATGPLIAGLLSMYPVPGIGPDHNKVIDILKNLEKKTRRGSSSGRGGRRGRGGTRGFRR